MNEVKKFILNNNITLVVVRPSFRMLLITNILNEISIKDIYKTVLFIFSFGSQYYLQKLISLLSGISYKLVTKYYYPYVYCNKNNSEKIDRDKFIDAIEKIQNSNIIMDSEKHDDSLEFTDYVLDYDDGEVLIIDNFYAFLNRTRYDIDKVFEKLEKDKNKHFILIISKKSEEQKNIIKKFNKYIENYVFIDGDNYVDYKDVNIKILNNHRENNLNFKFDKMNKIIKSVEGSNG